MSKLAYASCLLLSLLQFIVSAALLWGVDAPLVVAIATLLIVGPLTYLLERTRRRRKTRILAWQSSLIVTVLATVLAMLLSSMGYNHYHAVCYATFAAAGVFAIGINKATDKVLRIIAQGVVDMFKKAGWLDDDE